MRVYVGLIMYVRFLRFSSVPNRLLCRPSFVLLIHQVATILQVLA